MSKVVPKVKSLPWGKLCANQKGTVHFLTPNLMESTEQEKLVSPSQLQQQPQTSFVKFSSRNQTSLVLCCQFLTFGMCLFQESDALSISTITSTEATIKQSRFTQPIPTMDSTEQEELVSPSQLQQQPQTSFVNS